MRSLEQEVLALRQIMAVASSPLFAPTHQAQYHQLYLPPSALEQEYGTITAAQIESIPEPLQNLTTPLSVPVPQVSTKGQIFGIYTDGTPTSELYVHGAQAPHLIDLLNRHHPGVEQAVSLQHVFDESKYSARQESYLRMQLAYTRRNHPFPVPRLLQLRPHHTEVDDLWRVYMDYVNLLFHSGDVGDLLEEFRDFVCWDSPGPGPSAIAAARFATIMALGMAFCRQDQVEQWSVARDVLDREMMQRYPEMDARHFACRNYLSLAICALDGVEG
jgi:hypothetical protein